MSIDTNTYFAKSTYPGLNWRSEWMTLKDAQAKACWFVGQWIQNGLPATASVFYRDGKAVEHFGPEPDSIPQDGNPAEYGDSN